MSEQSDRIWQRGDARQIMKEARQQFYGTVAAGRETDALITLASVHYSLAKRYWNGLWKLVGAWHLWRACINIANVDVTKMSLDQIDVCSTVWSKAPRWLGGDQGRAFTAIRFALELHPDTESMKPHTRALLHITLGNIEMQDPTKHQGHAAVQYRAAEAMVHLIEEEKQLVRVLAAIGFFYFDTGGDHMTWYSYLVEALSLAQKVSRDQEEKIRNGLRKRRILLGHARE